MKSNKANSPLIRWTVLLLVVAVTVSGVWLWWQDALAPSDPTDKTSQVFMIPRGQSVKEISRRLWSERFIRSQTGFYVLVKFMGLESKIQAGDFRLNRAMDARTIALELTHGMLDVWITTLEGWRNEEIATKLAGDLKIPENEFLKTAQEGYMFPDTYLIPRDASASAVVALFRKNFDSKVTVQMRDDARKQGVTFAQAIILASIVEREGKTDQDRPMIAGILYNRLENDMPLQVDATVQYALGYQPDEKTWWKKELTEEDKQADSPYNTYLHAGLPPAPIANPGINSIRAALYPQKSDYLFYLHDKKGNAHYAKTLDEHTENIRKYLQ